MKMKTLNSITLSLVLSLLSLAPTQAADKKAQAAEEMRAHMAKAKEAGKPGAGHEVIKGLEGNWVVSSRAWMKPGEKPIVSAGSSSFAWVLEGRFLKQEFKGDWAGQAFDGLGYLGYDNVMKQYVSIWMDNMSTGIHQATGQYDAATKTITDQGSFSCPITGGKMPFRAEWKFVDKDKMIYSMFMKEPNGEKEMKSMEITYKRK